MSDAHPLVSIIVPSYNQGRYVAETLDSILSQDYRPIEVLVLDGGSSDQTVSILERYARHHPELHWWSERDKGVADAVNKGFARASGTIAGIQSSDDLYRPGAIREAVATLQSQPDVGIVCADCEVIDQDGRRLCLAPSRRPFSMASFLSRNTVIHQSSSFFRLELARAAGGWNAKYFCCDTELWLRLAFQTRILKLDRTWSAWRRHEAQRDKEAAKMWDAWGRMIDDCAPLKSAPLHLRLAAAAGRRLVALSYNPGRTGRFVTQQAWLALLTYPPCILGMYPRTALIPGFRRLRQWLGPDRTLPA